MTLPEKGKRMPDDGFRRLRRTPSAVYRFLRRFIFRFLFQECPNELELMSASFFTVVDTAGESPLVPILATKDLKISGLSEKVVGNGMAAITKHT